jgi:hypothetical protein
MILIAMLLAAAPPVSTPPAPNVDDSDREEIYGALLQCAAFHTIEAKRAVGDASAAQQATAVDYATIATLFVADGKVETVDSDLGAMLEDYREKLDGGDPRAMAEQWTALETACEELHRAKDRLAAQRQAELGKTANR